MKIAHIFLFGTDVEFRPESFSGLHSFKFQCVAIVCRCVGENLETLLHRVCVILRQLVQS